MTYNRGYKIVAGTVVFLCISYVIVCPYTKVEESFNLQAIHDLIYHQQDLEKYDHLEFPGVVPRSFIGPWAVAVISRPLTWLGHTCGLTKFSSQLIVRSVLGLLVCLSLLQFCHRVYGLYGRDVAISLLILTSAQFHFLYYASRPLPNTFALIFVLLAYSSWLSQNVCTFIWLAGLATIIFRSELSMLFGLILLQEVFGRRITIGAAIKYAIPAGLVSLGITVAVDSYYWKRWLWPEGEVLWFNTYDNKSSHWGTHPFFWYFYSALPKALTFAIFLIPYGIYQERRMWPLFLPAIGFTLAYSFLPHKELRFIIYTIPLFNTVAAAGLTRLWHNLSKLPVVIPLTVVAGIFLSCGVTACLLHVSRYNYPGGHGFAKLHGLMNGSLDRSMSESCNITVHISVDAAQTGVSRFGELQSHWSYSKAENLNLTELRSFTFLVVAVNNYKQYQNTHKVIARIPGYSRLKMNWKDWVIVRMIIEDKILVLQQRIISCAY